MHPAALLALLTIALLVFTALRLELDFRRTCQDGPGPEAPRPERRTSAPERRPTPELLAAPAGGYWQAPISPASFRAG